MQFTVTLNKGSIMFGLGLILAVASLSTFAIAKGSKPPLPSGWEFKIVEMRGESVSSDQWEPVGFQMEANNFAKVLMRRPISK